MAGAHVKPSGVRGRESRPGEGRGDRREPSLCGKEGGLARLEQAEPTGSACCVQCAEPLDTARTQCENSGAGLKNPFEGIGNTEESVLMRLLDKGIVILSNSVSNFSLIFPTILRNVGPL